MRNLLFGLFATLAIVAGRAEAQRKTHHILEEKGSDEYRNETTFRDQTGKTFIKRTDPYTGKVTWFDGNRRKIQMTDRSVAKTVKDPQTGKLTYFDQAGKKIDNPLLPDKAPVEGRKMVPGSLKKSATSATPKSKLPPVINDSNGPIRKSITPGAKKSTKAATKPTDPNSATKPK